MAITVEFSPSVTEAMGKHAERRRKRLERNFNRGLKELADGGNESARGLYESNQRIRLVCNDGEEGREILERNNVEFPKDIAALAGAGPAVPTEVGIPIGVGTGGVP